MKTTGRIFLSVILVALILAGCNSASKRAEVFTDDVYAPRYAGGFAIKGAPGRHSTVIEVGRAWQTDDSVAPAEAPALLVLRGDEELPAGFEGQVLRGDARRIVALSTTHVAMLDVLGVADRIVGLSGKDFVTAPSVRARLDSIAEIGYEGNIDYERLVGADPDLVLLFSVNGASAMEPKLKELGIPYLYIGDYCEESPIGKAEWLMVLAEVCGLRDKGRSVFDSIPARYEVVRKRAEKVATRPKAMFNAPYRDTWFMPYNSSYALRLVCDAGGQAVYSDNNTRRAVPVTMEQAYLLTDKADVWLVSGTYRTLRELCGDLPRFADTRPVVSGRVFNCTLRSVAGGGNDYWESGIVNPDLVLRDLMKIFHPELVSEPFVYYENLR